MIDLLLRGCYLLIHVYTRHHGILMVGRLVTYYLDKYFFHRLPVVQYSPFATGVVFTDHANLGVPSPSAPAPRPTIGNRKV